MRIPLVTSNSAAASPPPELSQKNSSDSTFYSILSDSSTGAGLGAADTAAAAAAPLSAAGQEKGTSSQEQGLQSSAVPGEGRLPSSGTISPAGDQVKGPTDDPTLQPDSAPRTGKRSADSAKENDARTSSSPSAGAAASPSAQSIVLSVPSPAISESVFTPGVFGFGDSLIGTSEQGAPTADRAARSLSTQGKTSPLPGDTRTSSGADGLPLEQEQALAGRDNHLDAGSSGGAESSTAATNAAEIASVDAAKSVQNATQQSLVSRLTLGTLATEGAGVLPNTTGPIPGLADGGSYLAFDSGGLGSLGADGFAQAAGAPGGGAPIGPAVAGSGGSTQAVAGKVVLKGAGDAGSSTNPLLADAADGGKNKSVETASGAGDGSSHNAQGNGSLAQNTQAAAALVAATVVRSVDGGTAATVAHPAAHDAAATQRGPETLGAAPRPAEPRELPEDAARVNGGEAAATAGINAAKLIQSLSESELRVGVNSAEFGNISIRASLSDQRVLAQISLDHSDLSQAISAHVSNVQSKIGAEYGVQTTIQVSHQGTSFSGESGQSSPREQRGYSRSARIEATEGPSEPDVGLSVGALGSTGNEDRLDVSA